MNFHYFYFQLSQSVEKKRALNQGSHFHLQSISEIKPKSMLPVAQECFFFSHFFLFFISISKNIIYMVITMTYQNYHTQKRTYFQGFLCSSKKSLLWKGKSWILFRPYIFVDYVTFRYEIIKSWGYPIPLMQDQNCFLNYLKPKSIICTYNF